MKSIVPLRPESFLIRISPSLWLSLLLEDARRGMGNKFDDSNARFLADDLIGFSLAVLDSGECQCDANFFFPFDISPSRSGGINFARDADKRFSQLLWARDVESILPPFLNRSEMRLSPFSRETSRARNDSGYIVISSQHSKCLRWL